MQRVVDRDEADLELTAVVIAVTAETPRVLTVNPSGSPSAAVDSRDGAGRLPNLTLPALPSGRVERTDRTLELGLRRLVRAQAGLDLGYVEQLYTFGDQARDPVGHAAPRRRVSVAYLALVPEMPPAPEAAWRDVYRFLPWEDRRAGANEPWPALDAALARWLGQRDDIAIRADRADIAFGRRGAALDEERVLERFELLYELGLAVEKGSDPSLAADAVTVESVAGGSIAGDTATGGAIAGEAMAGDHRRILATALGRLRGKVKYRPVVFELLPDAFTLNNLQRVVEALAGMPLHTANFRRLVEHGGLVEGTGRREATGGRPAELFRFRREVLRERTAPGVGLRAG